MEFRELSEQEFKTFLDSTPLHTFLQEPAIGKLRNTTNWSTNYLGIINNKKIIAACMLVSKITYQNKYEFYAPRGLLVDYNNLEILTFFTINLKKYIQNKNGYILRIDPYIIKQQRDINGDIVPDGINNKNIINNLVNLGYKKAPTNEQIDWSFALTIENKNANEIMKEMRFNTRNIIKKTLKIGITVRELDYSELNKFKEITESTSERRSFSDKPLEYYQNMYNLFKPINGVRYMIAEININNYLNRLNTELMDIQTKINKTPINTKSEGKLKEAHILAASLKNKIIEAKKMQKNEKENIVPLATAMFMTCGDEIIYLFSGNKGEYMHFNAQYLIQWEMINYGINNKFKKYNFYGINGNFDKSNPNYGIYEFKKGFNGYVEELIGEYELPINKYYNQFNHKRNFKHIIKKLLGR